MKYQFHNEWTFPRWIRENLDIPVVYDDGVQKMCIRTDRLIVRKTNATTSIRATIFDPTHPTTFHLLRHVTTVSVFDWSTEWFVRRAIIRVQVDRSTDTFHPAFSEGLLKRRRILGDRQSGFIVHDCPRCTSFCRAGCPAVMQKERNRMGCAIRGKPFGFLCHEFSEGR